MHVIGGQQDANAPALRVEREAVSCERLGDARAQFERVGRDCYVEVLDLPAQQHVAQEAAGRPGVDALHGEHGRQL